MRKGTRVGISATGTSSRGGRSHRRKFIGQGESSTDFVLGEPFLQNPFPHGQKFIKRGQVRMGRGFLLWVRMNEISFISRQWLSYVLSR